MLYFSVDILVVIIKNLFMLLFVVINNNILLNFGRYTSIANNVTYAFHFALSYTAIPYVCTTNIASVKTSAVANAGNITVSTFCCHTRTPDNYYSELFNYIAIGY